MNCDQIRDLLEAYSIGALDPDERIQLATHLSTCRDCGALARDYEEIVQMLPAALAEHSPHRLPETVKGRVMTAIATNHAMPTPVSRPAERPRRRLWTNL